MECQQCLSSNTIKCGKQKNGSQKYQCKICRTYFQKKYRYQSCAINDKLIVQLTKEGCGIRSISRILNISATTVITRILKIAKNIKKPPIPFGKKYQIDELITFIGNKDKKYCVVYALDPERKELLPSYSRSGALKSIKMDGNDYVNHIAYNPKGQRLLIAFGNSVMTRYLYDNRTFRLGRQRTEKYTESNWIYTSDGSVKQDTAYIYDLSGNILNSTEKNVSACGVGGTGSLSRDFDYDPLYRLLTANGRENAPTITPIWDDSYRSSDDSTTTAYTQNYQYDKLGNIQKLQHIGNSNFTRNFSYSSMNNMLDNFVVGTNTYNYTYDACGNQLSETTSRHFEWDMLNKLRAFYVQVGTSEPTQYAQYLYDSTGKRVKKIVRAQGGSYTSTTYINAVFEYKTDGIDEQNLLHVVDNSSRVALIRLGNSFGDTTPAIKYVIENFVRSSIVLLETNAASINMQEYYPFGESSFGSYAKKRYQYTGKERDEESGLYYYGARYYAAWTCRFISVDRLAANYMQLTPYQNAGNNPINDYDIDGNQGPGTPDTIDIVYPEGKSIKINKNEYGHYEVTQTQLDAIGPFGTNWNDDRSTDSSTIKLEPGGELDVVCDKCNHGIDSYVTIHIPKQVSVSYKDKNQTFKYIGPEPIRAEKSDVNNITFSNGMKSLDDFFGLNNYSDIKNEATQRAKEFYEGFTKHGFGANSTDPNSLVDFITIEYFKTSDPKVSSKMDTFLKLYTEQLKKYFGENVKIIPTDMNPSREDHGASVGATVQKKK